MQPRQLVIKNIEIIFARESSFSFYIMVFWALKTFFKNIKNRNQKLIPNGI
jgi:hypothetical protein